MTKDAFSAWETGRDIILRKTSTLGLQFQRIIKIADNCSSENKSQFRLAELKQEPVPTTVVFKTEGLFKF